MLTYHLGDLDDGLCSITHQLIIFLWKLKGDIKLLVY